MMSDLNTFVTKVLIPRIRGEISPVQVRKDVPMAELIPTRKFAMDQIRKIALHDRRPAEGKKPAETDAQAIARYITTDPLGKRAYEAYRDLPPDPIEAAPIVKRATASLPAYTELEKRAEAIRGANPSLTPAQAFQKAYEDPGNVALVRKYHNERWGITSHD